MKDLKISKIEEVNLREIWKSEAFDFTPWLAKSENLDLLSKTLELSLIEPELEVSVGSYSCDIKCRIENDNRVVIIENQLEDSNHDHLGKSIVYASGLDASIVVWIVKNAKQEHASAIEWLNLHSDANVLFFLIELKVIKIGNSDVAPMFKIIEGPNDYQKAVKGSQNKELTRSQMGRYKFWSSLNNYIEINNLNIEIRKPNYDHWRDIAIGSSQAHLSINLLDNKGQIRFLLVINNNKKIFDDLYKDRQTIENELGMVLEWDRKDDEIKSSSISTYLENFNFDDESNHPDLFKKISNLVALFRNSFKKRIQISLKS